MCCYVGTAKLQLYRRLALRVLDLIALEKKSAPSASSSSAAAAASPAVSTSVAASTLAPGTPGAAGTLKRGAATATSSDDVNSTPLGPPAKRGRLAAATPASSSSISSGAAPAGKPVSTSSGSKQDASGDVEMVQAASLAVVQPASAGASASTGTAAVPSGLAPADSSAALPSSSSSSAAAAVPSLVLEEPYASMPKIKLIEIMRELQIPVLRTQVEAHKAVQALYDSFGDLNAELSSSVLTQEQLAKHGKMNMSATPVDFRSNPWPARSSHAPVPEHNPIIGPHVPSVGAAPVSFKDQEITSHNLGAFLDSFAANAESIYCICKQSSGGEMIMCDNPDCEVEWYHVTCLRIKAGKLPKLWFCPSCQSKAARSDKGAQAVYPPLDLPSTVFRMFAPDGDKTQPAKRVPGKKRRKKHKRHH